MRSDQKCVAMMTVLSAMVMCIIFFGTAFAADYITRVSSPQTIYSGETTARLKAEVKPPEGVDISRVWAIIISPDDVPSFIA